MEIKIFGSVRLSVGSTPFDLTFSLEKTFPDKLSPTVLKLIKLENQLIKQNPNPNWQEAICLIKLKFKLDADGHIMQ